MDGESYKFTKLRETSTFNWQPIKIGDWSHLFTLFIKYVRWKL